MRERGTASPSHIETLLADLPAGCGIVTVIDGHPASLGWLGAVGGHRVRALGVDQFGQTGSLADLYRHYGIDSQAIITAAQALTQGPPIRYTGA
jgi:pyruvate dehydrogenase E1 component